MSSLRILECALAAVIAVGRVAWKTRKSKKRTILKSEAPNNELNEYPSPTPMLDFELNSAQPPRFRAFRYHYKRHVVDVSKLDRNSWVLLDKDWPKYFDLKAKRIEARGAQSMQCLPAAEKAAHELCQDLCEFLSRRYPTLYRIERAQHDSLGWYGLGSVTSIEMPTLGAKYDLVQEDPLHIAGMIQPADLNILIKMPDGKYQLSAMHLGIGGGQRIQDKLGKKLADLHLEGHVPHYKEQLQRPLDHFLTKLKFEAPIQRHTTAISIHDEWHWPAQMMGPEDDWDPTIGGPGVDTPAYRSWKRPGSITDISQLWFRQERQTLRRLPKSGAVVWMVHTYIEPLEEVVQEAGIPGRLASLIRSWDDEMAKHKSKHLYEGVLLPYLDGLHEEQVRSGVCPSGEMPSKFPW